MFVILKLDMSYLFCDKAVQLRLTEHFHFRLLIVTRPHTNDGSDAKPYPYVISPTAFGGALSRDQKLSDHIHWKWAFQVNMESAPN